MCACVSGSLSTEMHRLSSVLVTRGGAGEPEQVLFKRDHIS